jgi:hypothetical protein
MVLAINNRIVLYDTNHLVKYHFISLSNIDVFIINDVIYLATRRYMYIYIYNTEAVGIIIILSLDR